MKNELIYGQKPDITSATYVELNRKEDNKLDVIISVEGNLTTWHLIMKNPDKYEAFKAALIDEISKYSIEWINDTIQGQDIHDDYELEYDCPAQDTAILVSMDEIDDYISEVSTRLTFYIEGKCFGVDLLKHKIDPRKPLGNYSYDYWAGVMSALNWITMGGEKHDVEPQ